MQLKLIDPKSNSSCFVVAQPRPEILRWTTMTTMNHYLATMTTTFWLVNNRYDDGAKVVLFFHNWSFYRFFSSSYFFQYSQSTVLPLGIDTLLVTQKVTKKTNYSQQNWISKVANKLSAAIMWNNRLIRKDSSWLACKQTQKKGHQFVDFVVPLESSSKSFRHSNSGVARQH